MLYAYKRQPDLIHAAGLYHLDLTTGAFTLVNEAPSLWTVDGAGGRVP